MLTHRKAIAADAGRAGPQSGFDAASCRGSPEKIQSSCVHFPGSMKFSNARKTITTTITTFICDVDDL